jgi:hypothetical protein
MLRQVGTQSVPLYDLFIAVMHAGGREELRTNGAWAAIGHKLGVRDLSDSAAGKLLATQYTLKLQAMETELVKKKMKR